MMLFHGAAPDGSDATYRTIRVASDSLPETLDPSNNVRYVSSFWLLSLSAINTSSAKDLASIFRITLPR